MKKVIWILLLVLIVAVATFYFIGHKESTCVKIESKKLDIDGDAQVLIGYSEIKNDLIYLGLSLNEDSTMFNIFGRKNGLIGKDFFYGNYLNDSIMVVFDKDQRPFIFKSNLHKVDSLHSSINFSGLEIADIKIEKFKGNEGILINKGDSLIFYNVLSNRSDKLFSLNMIPEKYEGIKSFDISADKILVVLKRECLETGCNYDYFLVNTGDNSFRKIFALEEIKPNAYPPMVSFLDESTYVTSYFDKQAYLVKNSIDGAKGKVRCLTGLEIFNIETVQGEVYLTVIDDQARKNTTSKNPYKNLYSGIGIISVGRLE